MKTPKETVMANEVLSFEANVEFQIAEWRYAADFWSGKIDERITDKERAAHAVEQVQVWTAKLAAMP